MSEVVLPPIETEPEVPEVVIPEVEKPTALSKVISVNFNPLNTKVTTSIDTHEGFATTDTDAWIVLNILDMAESIGKYSLVLHNREDGSIFQRVGDIVKGVAYYKLIPDEVKHAGRWVGQVVVTLDNGQTTTSRFNFMVSGHLLDGKDVREIVIQDFQTLMKQLNDLKNNAGVDIEVLKNSVEETNRLANENELVRVEAESLREDAENARVVSYDSKVDAAIVATDVDSKVGAKVAELSPTINKAVSDLGVFKQETTAQFQQKADIGEVLQVQQQVDSFISETSTGMTDTGSLELVATRTDIDAYTFDNVGRRVDQIEKNIKELDVVAVIGDNHINANGFIGKPINTLNNVMIKLPKGVKLKNNTAYKFIVRVLNDTFPVDGSVVAFYRSDNTMIGSVPFNSSIGNPKLSETSYLKFTTYSAVGTMNVKTMGLFLNGKEYSPFTIDYQSNKLLELNKKTTFLTGEKINLYEPENTIIRYFNTGTGVVGNESINFRMVYAKCKPNTEYTVRKSKGMFFAVGESVTIPNLNTVISNITSNSALTNLTFTTTETAQYIVANVWSNSSDTLTPEEMLSSVFISEGEKNTYPVNSVFLGSSVIVEQENLSEEVKDLLNSTVVGGWKDKKWVSYGDSVTQAGLWQPYVTSELGFSVHEKNGVGGTTVSNANPINHLSQQERVDSIQTVNPDLIIVMGGTNDFGYNVPLGDFAYSNGFEESTFKGGFCSAIIKLQTKFPNTRIVVASPLSGRGNETGVNMTTQVKNTLGLTTEDYATAVEQVAQYLSVPYINIFGKTGINQFNRAKYLSDSVHPNDLGQKRMAEAVIGELKLLSPI